MGSYETKLIVKQMLEIIAGANTLEAAYTAIANSAKEEGVTLPSYKEKRDEIKKLNQAE